MELEGNTVPEIEKVFAAYYKERSPTGQTMVEMSSRLGHLMNKKVIAGSFFFAARQSTTGEKEAWQQSAG